MKDRGVPKLELLTCLCEPDRAKQSPTLREIASAEEHRLATTSSSIISDLGTPQFLLKVIHMHPVLSLRFQNSDHVYK